jgi:hypothetical protein
MTRFPKWLVMVATLIIAVSIHPTAKAGFIWDCIGPPTSSVFEVHDAGSYIQYDTPQPGIMYYNTLNHAGGIGSPGAWISMHTDLASTELNYQTGWSCEVRVDVLQNVRKPGLSWREYCGAAVAFSDGVREGCLFLRPDCVEVQGSNPGIPTLGSYQYDSPGYHTIRLEAIANSSLVNVFVDGEERISVTYSGPAELPSVFAFGDQSSNSDGEAYWDYVAVSTVPEPGTVMLMLSGFVFLALVRSVKVLPAMAQGWRLDRAKDRN